MPEDHFLASTARRLSGLQTNFILISGRRGDEAAVAAAAQGAAKGRGRVTGVEEWSRVTARAVETHYQPVSRNRSAGHERATVFVNVTTKLSAVPRLTRHSLKFHREIAPPARRARRARGLSHFAHCACPRFDNARLARRHESDPWFPLSLSPPSHFPPLHARIVAVESRLRPESTIGCLILSLRVLSRELPRDFMHRMARIFKTTRFIARYRANSLTQASMTLT